MNLYFLGLMRGCKKRKRESMTIHVSNIRIYFKLPNGTRKLAFFGKEGIMVERGKNKLSFCSKKNYANPVLVVSQRIFKYKSQHEIIEINHNFPLGFFTISRNDGTCFRSKNIDIDQLDSINSLLCEFRIRDNLIKRSAILLL
jgi:hypothetical protein